MEFVAEDNTTSSEAAATTAKIEEPTPSHRYVPYKSTKPRTEEQKLRKKAHNRRSASRYRSKKKQEEEEGSTKLAEVEAKNTSLRSSVDALQKEVDYLKGLLVDVVKARVAKNSAMKGREEKTVVDKDYIL